MIVHEGDAIDATEWNEFVQAQPDGTFFHLAEWGTAVHRAFGHPIYYLTAKDGQQVKGVLPLGRVRSRLFGDTLISVPFGVYGGILATDDLARDELTKAAQGLASRLGVDCLELRNRARMHEGWPHKDLYVTFRREMDPDPDANLKRIPRRQRAMVRRGIKAGLTSAIEDSTDNFYPMYAESVRNLGTPVFSRRLFDTLLETVPGACQVLTVFNDGRPVSSVMSFFFRNEVLPYYGGGTAEARTVAANDFMYWELMRRSCEQGVQIFDFGRSKRDTGSYRFKKHWGFEPQPLFYECALVRARTLPEVNPLNPKYALFIRTWKRLPLGVANTLGPLISKGLG